MTTCLNCGAALTGPYCAQCGQHITDPDLSMRELVHEVTHELTQVDGKVLRISADSTDRSEPGRPAAGLSYGRASTVRGS